MAGQTQLTFFEHLNELRNRLFIILIAVCAGTAAGYFASDRIIRILMRPVQAELPQVYFFSPAEAFLVKLKIAFIAGVFAASPVIFGELWVFFAPALYRREKKFALPIAGIMAVLFLMGAFFCFRFVMPVALRFLVGMQSEYLKPMISLSHYVDFVFGLLLAFGVAFNLPVFVLALVAVGLVKLATLQKYQRHAIVLIFILAAILTPSPDIASQVLLAIPLLILFELSVVGAWFIEQFKKKSARADSGADR